MRIWEIDNERRIATSGVVADNRAISAISLSFASCSALAHSSEDEAHIRTIAASWESAWNAHDMKALFSPVTADADFVNVGGKHWKGREQIEAEHSLRLSMFQESTWATKGVTVQFLKPDIALVHVSWGIVGDKDPDGSARKPRDGIFTWIVTKQRGHWQIRAAQNTNISNVPPPTVH